MRFSDEAVNDYRLKKQIVNTADLERGVYQHSSLYVDASHHRTGKLTCIVTDELGSYSASINIPQTGKVLDVVIKLVDGCIQSHNTPLGTTETTSLLS